MSDHGPAENTDKEIWRGPDEGCGDYYADSLYITKDGALGINCGGTVYEKPIREWHRIAGGPHKGLCAVAETDAVAPDDTRLVSGVSSDPISSSPSMRGSEKK